MSCCLDCLNVVQIKHILLFPFIFAHTLFASILLHRSTNPLSVDTTSVSTTNPPPNALLPTQLSFASNVPPKVEDVSSLPMVLPSLLN